MRRLSLTTLAAWSAIATVVLFAAGIVFMASSGVQVLIPETGREGLDWVADVNDAGDLFFAGAWLVIFGGLFALVALVGFYETFRGAGPALVLAPVLGVVAMTLVTISHLVPISIAYELAPDYASADAATKASLEATLDTLASLSLVLNYTGDAIGWGVVVPLYAYAILKTGAVPRWIGWLGLLTAVTAGWLGLVAPASDVVEAITSIGFFAFFAFLLALGIALLRRERVPDDELAPTTAR